MTASRDAAFLALGEDLLSAGYLYFDYVFEAADDAEAAALHLCQEQSTALWHRPGVDEDYRPRHAARLVELQLLGELERPSLPTRLQARKWQRARVRLGHPVANFGPRLPNLLTVAAGEGAFFTPGIAAIRLEDVVFPPDYLQAFAGPRFGVAGLRALLGVLERPLICGVVKPNIGLAPADFAELAYQAWRGGADIAKDDEMQADVDYSPLLVRARETFERLRRAEAETGERKLFLANVTDEIDVLMEHHDGIFDLGGDRGAIMLNAVPVGLSAARMLSKRGRLPLFAHFDMIAATSRVPTFGISTLVWTRLQRLAGFDAIIMPGLGSRMGTSVDEVCRDVRACLEPWGNIAPSLPLPGGSDWAGTLAPMVNTLQTRDFGIIPGRGIFGHPDGPAGGARSIRDAWELLSRGLDPAQHRDHTEALRLAYESFA
jgi:ribulose-bisphosphate carboxylase large chain